jgi:peptide/nickel transport system ATP-binding protein
MAGTGRAHLRDSDDIVLSVRDLVVEFPAGRSRRVHAVSGVSLDVARGETLGIVGESGCGKSTTGKAVMQMPRPTSGEVVFEGVDLVGLDKRSLREARTRIQMIFQDPISSLNPRRRVWDSVADPLDIWGRGTRAEQAALVDRILESVGIDPQRARESRPHQFSGGQCQRISIARALVLSPSLLICDEPVSALDVSVQAQVVNLLEDLKAEFGLTLMFIAHDLAVVKNISDRVAVMYLGKLCEVAPSADLYARPAHHYTRVLLDSIPVPDPTVPPRHVELGGELPSPMAPPPGCRFHTRCPAADDRCRSEEPQMTDLGGGHFVACHHPLVTPVTIGAVS